MRATSYEPYFSEDDKFKLTFKEGENGVVATVEFGKYKFDCSPEYVNKIINMCEFELQDYFGG